VGVALLYRVESVEVRALHGESSTGRALTDAELEAGSKEMGRAKALSEYCN
jgi:hypothetical protein